VFQQGQKTCPGQKAKVRRPRSSDGHQGGGGKRRERRKQREKGKQDSEPIDEVSLRGRITDGIGVGGVTGRPRRVVYHVRRNEKVKTQRWRLQKGHKK